MGRVQTPDVKLRRVGFKILKDLCHGLLSPVKDSTAITVRAKIGTARINPKKYSQGQKTIKKITRTRISSGKTG